MGWLLTEVILRQGDTCLEERCFCSGNAHAAEMVT
jgi:hypothetical protein